LDQDTLLRLVVVFVPMVLSLSVHEFAHAWSAHRLGDDTALRMGRMTVNPLAHVDLFGTVLLPLILVLTNAGFFFGWAKPVPVNPANFHRGVSMRRGMMITAAAASPRGSCLPASWSSSPSWSGTRCSTWWASSC